MDQLHTTQESACQTIPTEEPARQEYFMGRARELVMQLSAQLGRPMTCCINTFGCPTV